MSKRLKTSEPELGSSYWDWLPKEIQNTIIGYSYYQEDYEWEYGAYKRFFSATVLPELRDRCRYLTMEGGCWGVTNKRLRVRKVEYVDFEKPCREAEPQLTLTLYWDLLPKKPKVKKSQRRKNFESWDYYDKWGNYDVEQWLCF